jgi:hypothetical protein
MTWAAMFGPLGCDLQYELHYDVVPYGSVRYDTVLVEYGLLGYGPL